MTYKVAITGEFRRGKDTLANLIIDQLHEHVGGEVTRLAFADALKRELASMLFNYTLNDLDECIDEQLEEGYAGFLDTMLKERHINGAGWQWLGEWRRQHSGADYWINHYDLADKYARACDYGHHIIVTDMRHHNEAKWCSDNGFYLIRIEGPCHTEGELRDASHPSERHVKDLEVHLVIHNISGLDALREKVADKLMPKLARFFDASVPS